MGKTSDILKELEDIGALGNKVQDVAIRRAVPVLTVASFEPEPEPILVAGTRDVIAGFSVQLETLEVALRGMLNWCTAARGTLLVQDAPEEVRDDEIQAEEVKGETKQEMPVSAVVPEVVSVAAAKPRLSIAEIRKHFLDPEYQVKEAPVNGATNGTLVAPTTDGEAK